MHLVHPVMIMEYLVYGDLLGYLRKSRGIHDKYHLGQGSVPELEIYDLVLFAKQIAAGMVFLGSKGVSNHLIEIKLQQNSTGWVHIWTNSTSLTGDHIVVCWCIVIFKHIFVEKFSTVHSARLTNRLFAAVRLFCDWSRWCQWLSPVFVAWMV